MKTLVAWAAQNRLFALLFAAAILAAGAWAAYRIPIDAIPDVTSTQVQIVTRAPALSAVEMEQQVTQPVEREMAGLPGLARMRSITKLGISIVTLVFDEGTELYFARAITAERLVNVRDAIPEEIGRPELGPVSTALGEIIMFELRATDGRRSNEELRTILDWQVAPRLRQVPGVVEVIAFGGSAKQYRVTLDPARMAAHSISAADVRDALTRDNRLAGGGVIEQDGEQTVLRGDARYRGLEDIASTVVRADERGVPIRVGQLGEVDTGPAQRQGALTRDGRGEVVGGSVLMLKGRSSREVVSAVKSEIDRLAPLLPAGVTLETYYDRSAFIDRVLATIAKNLAEGAGIVVLCLLLTLGSVRAGLLVAGAIPFSMLAGITGLYLCGYSGNVMSLGAVDFGIIVEGAVLTVEHAMTHGAHVIDRERRRAAIVSAIQEVARPVLFVVTIVLLTFLPLATLEDVEGKMFRPVVYSLCFMLLGALVYALVVVPALAPSVLRASGAHGEPRLVRWLRRVYQPLLDVTLRRPKRTVLASFALAALLLLPAARLGASFLPRVFEGDFAIDAIRAPTTSLSYAVALGAETERALREVPEVRSVVNRIGRPEGAVDSAGPESSDVFVLLAPRSQWRPGLTPEALADELAAKVGPRVPGTVNAFSQPIEMRVNDLVAGVKSDVAIKIYADDLASMSATAARVLDAVARIPGASDFRAEPTTGLPAIAVSVDRERSGRLGVSASDALDLVTMARAGERVGVVREDERVFDLQLRIGGDSVTSAQDLARLPVPTRSGRLVPLAMVAAVEEERGVIQIGREQMRRRLVVQGNVRGRDVVSFVAEAQAAVNALDLPSSTELEWGGQFQSFNRAKARLTQLVPLALGIIGLLLVMTYRSVRQAIVTLLGLPFALAGGVTALWLRGLPFSIPAAVGFIAVAGISVTTGIVLTSQFAAQAPERQLFDRVRDAARASLRAPVSTALIAALGFLPAAIATGAGAEVQRPLATVVIGGLAVSMILSLFALPALLLLASRSSAADRRAIAPAHVQAVSAPPPAAES